MKVGLLLPRSGAAGIWGPACEAAMIIGAAEINASGGILGEEVDLVFADSGVTEMEALNSVETLIDIEGVEAIVGTHTSDIRDVISRRLTGRVPYIYTAQYEGIPVGPSTVAIGSTDIELMRPAFFWLTDTKRARKFFFVGNDYIWPRMVAGTTRALVQQQGGEMVGEAYRSRADFDHEDLLKQIAASGADVVIQALVGNCAIQFNRDFAAAGLDQKVLRFALIVDEPVLHGIGADASTNLFSASHYYSDWHSRANDTFLELYHQAFGELAPPVSAGSVAFYEGLHVLAGLARDNQTSDRVKLAHLMQRPISRLKARHVLVNKPVGEFPRVHIAAAEGLAFRVVATL